MNRIISIDKDDGMIIVSQNGATVAQPVRCLSERAFEVFWNIVDWMQENPNSESTLQFISFLDSDRMDISDMTKVEDWIADEERVAFEAWNN